MGEEAETMEEPEEGDEEYEILFWTRRGCYTRKLPGTMVSCMRPLQNGACKCSIRGEEGAREVLPLLEGLLAITEEWESSSYQRCKHS